MSCSTGEFLYVCVNSHLHTVYAMRAASAKVSRVTQCKVTPQLFIRSCGLYVCVCSCACVSVYVWFEEGEVGFYVQKCCMFEPSSDHTAPRTLTACLLRLPRHKRGSLKESRPKQFGWSFALTMALQLRGGKHTQGNTTSPLSAWERG